MVTIFAHWMFWTLNGYKVFEIPFSALHGQPVKAFCPLVLVALDEVPTQDKVLCDVIDAVSNDPHGDVMPGHSAIVCFAELVRLPVVDALEVHDAVVVEVLTWEELVGDACRVDVRARVLSIVPPPEAQIQSANESQSVVDNDEFLMVRPVKCHVASVLEDVVIRMSHHGDIAITWTPLRTQRVQSMLGVCTVATDGCCHFLVYNHVDFHPSLCPPLQHLIEPPFLVVVWWSAQKELRAEPPVGNIDGLLGLLQRDRDSPEVVSPVDIPLDLVAISLRSEGLEAVALRDPGALLVGGLLMLLVVPVVGVDDVAEFADLVLEVDGADFGVIEMCSCRRMRSVRGSSGDCQGGLVRGLEGARTVLVPFNCSRSSGKGCFSLSAKPGILRQIH